MPDEQPVTPEMIRQVLTHISRSRTPEQRKGGGRPKGYQMSPESRAKISETKRAAAGPREDKPKRPRGRPRKATPIEGGQ